MGQRCAAEAPRSGKDRRTMSNEHNSAGGERDNALPSVEQVARLDAFLDQLIADLGTNPLAKGELRQVRQGVYVSLSQSQPENLDFAFCLSSGRRMYYCFRKAAEHSS